MTRHQPKGWWNHLSGAALHRLRPGMITAFFGFTGVNASIWMAATLRVRLSLGFSLAALPSFYRLQSGASHGIYAIHFLLSRIFLKLLGLPMFGVRDTHSTVSFSMRDAPLCRPTRPCDSCPLIRSALAVDGSSNWSTAGHQEVDLTLMNSSVIQNSSMIRL